MGQNTYKYWCAFVPRAGTRAHTLSAMPKTPTVPARDDLFPLAANKTPFNSMANSLVSKCPASR